VADTSVRARSGGHRSTAGRGEGIFRGAMMLKTLSVLSLIGVLGACDAAEKGRAEARREAAAEREKTKAAMKPAARVEVAVSKGQHRPCSQLMDPPAYTAALGELEPLTVREATGAMTDATASCSLIRGGKRPDEKEQDRIIKKQGRLGSIPGDEVCNVTLYCWVVDDEPRFASRCKPSPAEPFKSPDSAATGGFACKETRPQGEFDIDSYKFYDAKTRCLFAVRGGPSMTDNDFIATCAKVARESIQPEHIKAGAPARYEIAPPADGTGAAAATP
jgi:hypothetical protein